MCRVEIIVEKALLEKVFEILKELKLEKYTETLESIPDKIKLIITVHKFEKDILEYKLHSLLSK